MDLRAIAHRLSGNVAGPDTILMPGPGHGPRDRSLAIRLDPQAPDGFLVHSHAGDDWRVCRDHARALLGLPPWAPGDGQGRTIPQYHAKKWDLAAAEAEVSEPDLVWTEEQLARMARAQEIWAEARDPRRTVAEAYLREVRGLDLTDDLACSVLRYHSRCPWRNEDTGNIDRVDALIAPFRSIRSNSITAIQRVALRSNGSKIARRMLGIVYRCAIKLDAVSDRLAVGEGLETCLAARQLGFSPAWAVGSVGMIAHFPLIKGVNCLTLLGETGDPSWRAVNICGPRWRQAGRRVRVVMPEVGSDLNDVLLTERARS